MIPSRFIYFARIRSLHPTPMTENAMRDTIKAEVEGGFAPTGRTADALWGEFVLTGKLEYETPSGDFVSLFALPAPEGIPVRVNASLRDVCQACGKVPSLLIMWDQPGVGLLCAHCAENVD